MITSQVITSTRWMESITPSKAEKPKVSRT